MNDKNQMIITNFFREDEKGVKASLSPSEIKEIVRSVCNTLKENGFEPVRQIIGYIVSEDPAYIPDYDNARVLLSKIDRDLLLSELIKSYIGIETDAEENND